MARAARTVGVLPLVGALATATALTGAALFTVTQAPCMDGAQYVQRGGDIELVGSCLTPAELPEAPHRKDIPHPQQHGAYGAEHSRP